MSGAVLSPIPGAFIIDRYRADAAALFRVRRCTRAQIVFLWRGCGVLMTSPKTLADDDVYGHLDAMSDRLLHTASLPPDDPKHVSRKDLLRSLLHKLKSARAAADIKPLAGGDALDWAYWVLCMYKFGAIAGGGYQNGIQYLGCTNDRTFAKATTALHLSFGTVPRAPSRK